MDNIYKLYTPEQLESVHNSDMYTMFYAIVGQTIIDELGTDGEACVREGTRRYGEDRGIYRRNRHLDANIKINMKSLFSIGNDLPPDPRFQRDLRRLVPEERTSHTLRCPMAEIWHKNGYDYIGRLYCEEFHPACYKAYAFGYTKVGLARTITQKGDKFCSFNVVLRPSDIPEELKSTCFEEYDPFYTGQTKTIPPATAKGGFNFLTVRIFYYTVKAIYETFGDKGEDAIAKGLKKAGEFANDYLKNAAKQMDVAFSKDFAEKNFPLYQDPDSDPLWEKYNEVDAKGLLKKYFYPVLNCGIVD